MTNKPLISCLCITHDRAAYLRIAIECFLEQFYSNRQLVIVHLQDDWGTIELIKSYEKPQIKAICIDKKYGNLSLGELRNIGVASCDGEYVCVWDDYDWHHPNRLTQQLDCIQKFHKKTCILSKILMYDKLKNNAYLSVSRLWEGTILFEKKSLEDLRLQYPQLNRAEDYHLINELIRHNKVYPLLDPTLYIYQATGVNTCEREHFENFYADSDLLFDYQTLIIRKSVNGDLSPLDASIKMQTKNFMETLCFVAYSETRN